ncbi:MAG: RpiB/LacA/LacB family sugar-phosphate isomerase [Pseudonocardia sp.]|nr:RpiB/LacA/LacB family sugar-phosphate isomerase [Pseudonocardia sp.]
MRHRVAFGTDDQNECVTAVLEYLRSVADLEVVQPSDSWPEFSRAVGERVARGEADFGVLMCWTGTGTAIAANKVKGVRAAQAWDPWIAESARRWNDANVLALSLKRTAPDVAVECVKAFLSVAQSDPDERETIARMRDL